MRRFFWGFFFGCVPVAAETDPAFTGGQSGEDSSCAETVNLEWSESAPELNFSASDALGDGLWATTLVLDGEETPLAIHLAPEEVVFGESGCQITVRGTLTFSSADGRLEAAFPAKFTAFDLDEGAALYAEVNAEDLLGSWTPDASEFVVDGSFWADATEGSWRDDEGNELGQWGLDN